MKVFFVESKENLLQQNYIIDQNDSWQSAQGGTPGLCKTITVTKNCNFTRSNSLWASVPELLRHYITYKAILRIKAGAGCSWSFLFESSNSFCRSSNLLISAVLVNCLSPQRSANFFDDFNLCVKICSIYQHLWINAQKWWNCCVWSQCWFPISTAAWLVICWAAKKCRNCSNQLVIIPPTHQKHPNTRQQPPVQVVSNMPTSFGAHSFYRSPLEFEPLRKGILSNYFFAIQLPLSNRYCWHSCISWQLVI